MKFTHKIYDENFKFPILDILNTFPDDLTDEYGNKYYSNSKDFESAIA